MKLVQVINGEIAQYSLPKTGTLKNGSTVSGYHLLDEEVLLDEGLVTIRRMLNQSMMRNSISS